LQAGDLPSAFEHTDDNGHGMVLFAHGRLDVSAVDSFFVTKGALHDDFLAPIKARQSNLNRSPGRDDSIEFREMVLARKIFDPLFGQLLGVLDGLLFASSVIAPATNAFAIW
jgi:hypothetical protein